MKYTFHIVDGFSSTPFGGNRLAILPGAAGISTEEMHKIAGEFNVGKTTFVLPKSDPANTYRVRSLTPRAEFDFEAILGVDRGSRVLLFNIEGATHPASYVQHLARTSEGVLEACAAAVK